MKIESIKEIMVRLAEVELTESPVITCVVNLNQTHQKATEEMEQQATEVSRGLTGGQKKCFDDACFHKRVVIREAFQSGGGKKRVCDEIPQCNFDVGFCPQVIYHVSLLSNLGTRLLTGSILNNTL